MKKLGIMNSPQFAQMMIDNNITDPDKAFRFLMQRTRQQQGLVRREDRQALAGTGGGMGAGAAPRPAAGGELISTAAADKKLAQGVQLDLTRGSATAVPSEPPGAPPSTYAGVDAARRAAISHVLIGANETAQARSLADQPTGFAESLRGLPVGRTPAAWEDDPGNKRAKAVWARQRLGGN